MNYVIHKQLELLRWDSQQTTKNTVLPEPQPSLKLNSVALFRKRTIPTERPPHVGEVSAYFSGYRVSRGQRNGSQRSLILIF
jgi:hypothetical protein